MEIKVGHSLSIPEAFRLAIEEGQKGYGFVAPNPAVGCALLDRDFRLISVGYHEKFGGPHAEVEAVNRVKDRKQLEGAIAVVTLEPCAHHGKTPPCAELLAGLPLAEVHYGIKDPNPLVHGKGLDIIRAAGIKVIEAPVEVQDELEFLSEMFLINQRSKETFVGVKLATSLDGMMSLKSGQSQWITSQEAREQGHFLRAKYGAVLSTAKSVMADDSTLNSRTKKFLDKRIPVALIDEEGVACDYLFGSKLMSVRDPSEVFIFTREEHQKKYLKMPKAQIVSIPTKDEFLDLRLVFQSLWKLGLGSVLVEAGPSLTSRLIGLGLYHRLELFLGNKIIGANERGSWTKGLSHSSIDDAKGLRGLTARSFGQDLLISGRNPNSFNSLFS